jgi:predicted dehydrogenase
MGQERMHQGSASTDPKTPLRAAVVGVGHYGRSHAEKYVQHPSADLVAVVDIDPDRAQAVGKEFGASIFTDYARIFDSVDMVSVATPATTHFEIARAFLDQGIHVLVEKPIATDLQQADGLIALAEQKGGILQVGHQERFFASQIGLDSLTGEPQEIVCRRTGPFTGRGTDCNVVLDLMIHDIDLMHSVLTSALGPVSAHGTAVHGRFEDEAEVTIHTDSGCKVHLLASRVSDRRERSIEIISAEGSVEVDFIARTVHHAVDGQAMNGTQVNGQVNGCAVPQDLLAVEIAAAHRTAAPGQRQGRSPCPGDGAHDQSQPETLAGARRWPVPGALIRRRWPRFFKSRPSHQSPTKSASST